MSESRRQFIKKSISAAAIIPAIGTSSLFANTFSNDLNNEELLKQFDIWVDKYIIEIRKEKELGREFKDNKALVDLPAQMEEMMPLFKSRFGQDDFLKRYVQISHKLSLEIDSKF